MPLSTLTRRALLAGAGTTIASAAMGASAASVLSNDAIPRDEAVGPLARYQSALAELKSAAEALHPNIERWIETGGEGGRILMCVFRVEYSGYGVYEIQMKNSAGKAVRPIVALTSSEAGVGYLWQHYWSNNGKDRFQGEPEYIAAADLTIIRKIKALA
jgi:hypothetical protein